MKEARGGPSTEIYREAIEFQGGHKGDKGGESSAQNSNFKAKKSEGGSPGEDTGQGGLPEGGEGQKG